MFSMQLSKLVAGLCHQIRHVFQEVECLGILIFSNRAIPTCVSSKSLSLRTLLKATYVRANGRSDVPKLMTLVYGERKGDA